MTDAMTDVERYIADQSWYPGFLRAQRAAGRGAWAQTTPNDVLRAALPGILAAHRADVLRAVAEHPWIDPRLAAVWRSAGGAVTP